jgi:Family of unknown function (DUF5675)
VEGAVLGYETREGIQIHIGNVPEHSTGCILIGSSSSYSECRLRNSEGAYNRLRGAFFDLPVLNITPNPDLIDADIIGKRLSVEIDYAPRALRYIGTGFYYVSDDGEWYAYFQKGNKRTGSVYKELSRNMKFIVTKATAGPYAGQLVRWEIGGGRLERSSDAKTWHLIELSFRRQE